MIKAVLFDLDGTLLDTSKDIRCVLNQSLTEFGLPPVSLEKTLEFVGDGAKKLVERAVGVENFPLAEGVYSRFSEAFATCGNELTELYDGADTALKNFSAAGIKLAVVTNKPQKAAENVFKKFLSGYGFSIVAGQTEEFPLKPDPSLTLGVIKKLGVLKRECLFVGDGETDVLTARNAGIDCASALWGFRTRRQLENAGASTFASNFAELEKIVLNT